MRLRAVVATCVPLTLAMAGLSLIGTATSQAATLVPQAAGPSAGALPSSLLNQTPSWAECYPDDGYPELQCAAVKVPKNWDKPAAATITVAVSRIVATNPAKRRGVLFSNPGGPGGEGLTLPLFLEESEPKVAAVYDVIGIDVRGVGQSTTLTCADPAIISELYSLDGRDTSAANQRRFGALSKKYAQQCSKDPLTPVINDVQTAKDFDLIRALLGEKKISYLGFSAGTLLGATYASLFPGRVDRFLLDGNIDWTSHLYDSFNRQPHGFQNSFDTYMLPWIAKYDSVYQLGASAKAVNKTYEKRRAALATTPITLVDGTVLDASTYDFGVSGALYWTGQYDPVATAMQTIEHYSTASDDEKQLVADYFGGSSSDGADPFWAVVCQNDPGPSYSQITSFTDRYRVTDPLLGANWNAYPCPFFTTGFASAPIDGRKLPAMLMLNNDADPATPLANAVSANAATPKTDLVMIKNQPDHTIYGYGDECAEGYANAWLLRGVLPGRNVSCPGLPLPEPAALTVGAASLRTAAASPGRVPAGVWLDQFAAEHGQPKVG